MGFRPEKRYMAVKTALDHKVTGISSAANLPIFQLTGEPGRNEGNLANA